MKRYLGAICMASALAAVAPVRADDGAGGKGLPEQIVDQMNVLFGKHPGYRAAHAKGIVCEGEFTPVETAASVSRAAHFRGKAVKASFRFSDATGLPGVPDGADIANPHGLGVRFHLPDGESTDIVLNAFNGFAVSNGDDFLGMLKAVAASGPSVPKPTPIEKFLEAHPKALKVVKTPKPSPASFGTEPYFGNNAFEFTNGEGKARYGRYVLRPEEPVKFLTAAEAAKQPANYLMDELRERLAKGPVKFRLFVQLAGEGDPVNDATAVWPDDRPVVELGVLSVVAPAANNEVAQKALGFDPTRLVDGIETSDDPLLELRSEVYAISRQRRK